ncbi:ionotropic receptor 21a [Plodia interpunctella]|uniref:ionotropic receptor 21a n=1 Tax=Plodia interpunctella TaxID=58824 RepID=UPI0023678546|nr:ionotropic receptor 21a [Plodia interpunctella]
MRFKLHFVFISIHLTTTTCEMTEYYPSQSLLNTKLKKLFKDNWNITEYDKSVNFFNNKAYGKIEWRHFGEQENVVKNITKRAIDPVFHGHPKTREELWNEHFLNKTKTFDQNPSLITLIHNITMTYLNDCIPVILYDDQIKSGDNYLFEDLLMDFPISYVHGYINQDNRLKEPRLLFGTEECLHFIVFLTDIMRSAKVLGKQSVCKVVIVARSSQWAVQEFLFSPLSRKFVNLLVIGQSFKDDDDETIEAPYILYTHKLYTDGLGASKPVVLTSWSHGKFSRHVNLFPMKMTEGYAGHRFVVAAAHQPPFVFRRIITDLDGGNPRIKWDGIEIRLLKLLAEKNNFSIEVIEPREPNLGSSDAVLKDIAKGRADIGIAGIYLTSERAIQVDISFSHSQDCAVFVTLMSTALPRYRAILGPFHWHVWVALTFTYLIGIFPLAFSDKHTLKHLLHNSGEVENMFWYVFGTFTNCFTFVGKNSWSKTTKVTTRLLIGWYWIFTIIITSCYTGSIIAFVTLPIFPETVDTIDQLLSGFYRVGTLGRGGWERWFLNSSDTKAKKLFKKLELVPNVESGIRNITKAFFWPYAFLGSQAELQYIVQSNFSKTSSKRALLHIADECFVPFGVSMVFPNNSLYSAKLSDDMRRVFQSGLMDKIVDEVRWDIQRSNTGKFLAVIPGNFHITSAEEKGLTLEDTQGMFLLLAAGFLLAAAALISEWMGGISQRCRRKKPPSAKSQEHLIPSEIREVSNVDPRNSSAESRNTLDGEIINITEDDIMVHENFNTDVLESRRSSSVDLDKEVQEIFEKDMMRRNIIRGDTIEFDDDREPTASKENFGDRIKL